jgi:hypothetical protein
MDLSWLENNYEKEFVTKYITKYEKNWHFIFILNNWNAVNFIHGAVVDNFILLVQKEMIDSIIELSKEKLKNKIYYWFDNIKLKNKIYYWFDNIKLRIADSWLNNFLKLNI